MLANIKIVKIESFDTGFKRLQNARLENSNELFLYEYEKAEFMLDQVSCKEIIPTTYYALAEKIEFQRSLYKKLKLIYDIDLFNLPGILYLNVDGKNVGLCPPFVEEYVEENGEVVRALQDGVHRLLLAKQNSVYQRCILIKNPHANLEYLPYAYPNSWKEVKIVKKVPIIKKKYRRKDRYSFMRPLSAIFDKKMNIKWKDYGR